MNVGERYMPAKRKKENRGDSHDHPPKATQKRGDNHDHPAQGAKESATNPRSVNVTMQEMYTEECQPTSSQVKVEDLVMDEDDA